MKEEFSAMYDLAPMEDHPSVERAKGQEETCFLICKRGEEEVEEKASYTNKRTSP